MAFFTRKFVLPAGLCFAALAGSAHANCNGDLEGAWERRPAFSADEFEPVEEFRLNSVTGQLEDCTRDISYDARLTKTGRSFTFLYRAQAQTLHPVGDGLYVSKLETRAQDGQRWQYRFRLEAAPS